MDYNSKSVKKRAEKAVLGFTIKGVK